jgi:hypothetical protein
MEARALGVATRKRQHGHSVGMSKRLGMSAESKLFGGLVLLVGAMVVAGVAWDIYLHSPDPEPVGTAKIVVSGTGGVAFKGTVGTVRDEHAIEARTPLAFSVPYRRADYITTTISPVEEGGQGTLKAEIRELVTIGDRTVERTVEEGQTEAAGGEVLLVWKAPRGDNP